VRRYLDHNNKFKPLLILSPKQIIQGAQDYKRQGYEEFKNESESDEQQNERKFYQMKRNPIIHVPIFPYP
jgi:hypothetical protein